MICATVRAMGVALLSIGFLTFAIAADAPAESAPIVTRDFGWSNTNIAGKKAGEIGGTIRYSATPVSYADKSVVRTLNDRLTASGTISLPKQPASQTSVFIGWFNSSVRGWQQPICIGFRVTGDDDGKGGYGKIYTYAMTGVWNSAAGVQQTPFQIPHDGARHDWTLSYDPAANEGHGAVTFSLDGAEPFTARLRPHHMARDATFDRFGILNVVASSDPLTIYLDDLQYDDKKQDFSADPRWEKKGGDAVTNRLVAPEPAPGQDTPDEQIKLGPDGSMNFYTKNTEGKFTRTFAITPRGSLIAGGVSRIGHDTPQTNEPPTIDPAVYDKAESGKRLAWVHDFYFGRNKYQGPGHHQDERQGQPLLYLRGLILSGRGDDPGIHLGRAGPDDPHTSYGPLEDTPPGATLGKILFKAYTNEDGWTGGIAGIHGRVEGVPTKAKRPGSLHFTTAGESVKGNAWRAGIERMIISSRGYVGIGDEFKSPTERLHVQGNILAEGSVTAAGDVVARGAKKFVIDHPTRPGQTLTHAAIEGAEAAIYYRGEAKLKSGRAVVSLPEYFEGIARSEGRTVTLTNVDGFDRLAVQKQSGLLVRDGTFIVLSENMESSQSFCWEVKAVRTDIDPLQVER